MPWVASPGRKDAAEPYADDVRTLLLVLLLVVACTPGSPTPVSLAYTVTGQGSTVVLLHGHPQTSSSWRTVVPRLAERHRVVVVDQRGQGASPAPDGGYDVRTRARDVAVLLRRLDVEQAAVVGTDLGGHTAFALALEAEQLVILLLPSAVVWVEHGTKATGAWTR